MNPLLPPSPRPSPCPPARPSARHGRRGLIATLVLALGMSLGSTAVSAADDFPSKPVRLVIPFAAGGTMDLFGRLVAEEMGKALKQNVIADNVPGAGGSIATSQVARAAPDGYTMCFCATGSVVILPLMDAKLNYKVPDDVPPVGHVLRIEQSILVHAQSGAKTLDELVERAKREPGRVTYGTPGNGTSNHLAGELFKIAADADITTVHYRGESGAVIDLTGERIDFMVASVSFAEPHVNSGKLRILALTGPERLSRFPNLPTIAESGFPGYAAATEVGLHASKGTPRERIEVLNRALNTALRSPALRERMAASGVSPTGGGVDHYAAFLKAETQKWGDVIRKAGITLQ